MSLTKRPAKNRIDKVLNLCFKSLSDREQHILISAEGLIPNIPKRTLADIGRELGISRERTRQLYNRSIDKFAEVISTPALQRKVNKILSSIEMKETGNNLSDFYSTSNKAFPSGSFEKISCLSLLYRQTNGRLITKNNEVPFIPQFKRIEPLQVHSIKPFPAIHWFRGLGKNELNYLAKRFNLFKRKTSLDKYSVPANLWNTLNYRGLHLYLKASQSYPFVENELKVILETLEREQGSITTEAIQELVSTRFNLKGLNSLGFCYFLSDFFKEFKYDVKHFLWVRKGYSWKNNKRYMHNRSEILAASGKEMSHTNIAHKILLEEKKAIPVNSIVETAIERGLMKTTSSNPGGGMKTLIYLEIKRDKKLGRESRFKIHSDWRIELTGKGREFTPGDCRLSRHSSKKTLADYAYHIILTHKDAMHYEEIYDAIKKHPDMCIREDSSETSIKRVMVAEEKNQISRFKRLENGYWALSENHKTFKKSNL